MEILNSRDFKSGVCRRAGSNTRRLTLRKVASDCGERLRLQSPVRLEWRWKEDVRDNGDRERFGRLRNGIVKIQRSPYLSKEIRQNDRVFKDLRLDADLGWLSARSQKNETYVAFEI